MEGLAKEDGGFAGTPFTQFSITRDYNCAPHDDPNDYGFGLFCGYILVSGILQSLSSSVFKMY